VILLENRIALIGIIVNNKLSTVKLNTLLHEYCDYIIGRMGIPYKQKNISIISVVIDAPNNVINSLAGKIGALDGVDVKTQYSSY